MLPFIMFDNLENTNTSYIWYILLKWIIIYFVSLYSFVTCKPYTNDKKDQNCDRHSYWLDGI